MENEISKKKSNRVIYFDILNIIAIIAVIAMHCNSIVHGKPNSTAWITSLIIECMCYFAVPLFCMLSGVTLMNYREKYDTKTFFKSELTDEDVYLPITIGELKAINQQCKELGWIE